VFIIFSLPLRGVLNGAVALLLAPTCIAQAAAVELTLQPKLCVLTAAETVCRDQIKINWRAGLERSLCLYQGGQAEPLNCWQQSRSGSYISSVTTKTNIQFQLMDASGQQVLATQAFKVIADAKRYRRRRRNPWSFF
jgi:hypothetical protein